MFKDIIELRRQIRTRNTIGPCNISNPWRIRNSQSPVTADSPPYTLLLDWRAAILGDHRSLPLAPCPLHRRYCLPACRRPGDQQCAMAIRYRYGCFKSRHDKHRIISIQQYVVQCRPMSSLLCAPGSMYRWVICNLPARRRTPHSPRNTIDSRQYPRGVVVVVLVVIVNPTQPKGYGYKVLSQPRNPCCRISNSRERT